MKNLLTSTLLIVAFSTSVFAAPREFIQYNLDERQERAEELNEEIIRLDAKLERKILRIETRFLQSQDSKDSGISVHLTKEKLIQELADLAKYYKQQRDLFVKESQRTMPRADTQLLKKIADEYDKRINTRIDQIIALNNSFKSPHPDSKSGNNKQLARRTLAQQNAAREALEGIIARLEQENKRLSAQTSGLSEHDAAMIRETIETNEKLIDKREDQLSELDEGGRNKARALSNSEALQLKKLLEASVTDIKEDSYRLSNLVIEYVKEEQAVLSLKAELERTPPSPQRK